MNAELSHAKETLGLVLTGGGARAAYQVGVLKGIAELLPRGSSSPFQVITGTSAGAVSAVALASDPAHFRHAVYAIEKVWREFRTHHVIRADALSMLRSGLRWAFALLSGGWLTSPPRSLFDNAPLWELLGRNLHFEGIPRGMYKHHLQAVGICATSYSDADSVTFYTCSKSIEPWTRAARKGARVQLTLEHLMASLSIPFLFPPILLHQQYFGDGAMRQISPLSPAIHLGAGRLLVSGVGDPAVAGSGMPAMRREPTFGQVFGFMLDSLFMDQLQSDLERLRSNAGDARMPGADCLVVTPSRGLSEIAGRHRAELPRSLRVLFRTMGASPGYPSMGTLLSYLLFERGYTRELIALGLSDARARADEIRAFLDQKDVKLSAASRGA